MAARTIDGRYMYAENGTPDYSWQVGRVTGIGETEWRDALAQYANEDTPITLHFSKFYGDGSGCGDVAEATAIFGRITEYVLMDGIRNEERDFWQKSLQNAM